MKKLVLLLSVSVFLFSCSKDTDKTKPTIDALNIDNKTEEIEVQAGQSMTLQYTVSDEVGLSEMRLDVHDAFDGHTHGKTSSFNKLFWEQIDTLNGLTETTNSITVDVPANTTAGPYHLDAIVVDLAGNQSDIGLLDFTVLNAGMAMITITSHNLSSMVDVPKGSWFVLQGSVSDDIDLDEVIIVMEEEGHTHGKTATGEYYMSESELTGSNDIMFSITDSIWVGQNDAGHYMLEVIAIDSDGNMSITEGELHVE